MSDTQVRSSGRWWLAGGVVAACIVTGVTVAWTRTGGPAAQAIEAVLPVRRSAVFDVAVVHPREEVLERTTSQPGSIQAFESVQLFAGVSGYLQSQTVDIGDRIQRGQVLATVAVPELDKQVQRRRAAVQQTQARVRQMKAWVVHAEAEVKAAEAMVPQAEANAKSKAAELRFRDKQLKRMKDLLALNSVDERLVDEKTEQRDAALEAELAAREGVTSSRARLAAAAAKVQQAEADVTEAEAEVSVAQAELEGAQELVKFATIVAPFDGVVTQRSCFPGDYIRAASGGAQLPLLTVQRTDRMRVIVNVPDRDVPYVDPGDPATVEIDALPGEKLTAKVARLAQSEDAATRLMHVEIDLPNPTGRLRSGMYGKVNILLDRANLLTVPASCLVEKPHDGKSKVYVVEKGCALLRAVTVGPDDRGQVGILSGLTASDAVIEHPPAEVSHGARVAPTVVTAEAGHGH